MNLTEATHLRLTSLAAFLVPAMALWLPSGYAWGTALLLIGALLGAPYWMRWPVATDTRWLAGAVLVMALVWLHGSDWSSGSAWGDGGSESGAAKPEGADAGWGNDSAWGDESSATEPATPGSEAAPAAPAAPATEGYGADDPMKAMQDALKTQ